MISLSLESYFCIRKFILKYLWGFVFFYLNIYIVLEILKIIVYRSYSLLVVYTILSFTYEFCVFYNLKYLLSFSITF